MPGFRDKATVACPACGAMNTLGHPFCAKCGTALYRDKAPEVIRTKKEHGGPRPAVRNFILALIGVWLLASALLVAWPFTPLGIVGTSPQAVEVDRALQRLEQAAAGTGLVQPQLLTEEALNAFAARHGTVGQDARIFIETQRISLVAAEQFRQLTLSTRIVLERKPEAEAFKVERVWWGHLPLPRWMARRMARNVASRFQLDIPEGVWGRIQVAEAERGRLTLQVIP